MEKSAETKFLDCNFKVEVYEKEPEGFACSVQAAACYIEIDEKILLLRLTGNVIETGRWGVPAGKLEQGESALQAAIRELLEETGISVNENQTHALGVLYIRKPHICYVYHLFQVNLERAEQIRLSAEHDAYIWASKEDLKSLPLMTGAEQTFGYYRKTRQLQTD